MKRIKRNVHALSSSKIVIRSQSIPENGHSEIKECYLVKGNRISEAMQVGLNEMKKESNLSNLLEDECLRKMAFNLIK